MFDSWTIVGENDHGIYTFYVIDKSTIVASMKDSLWNRGIMKTTTGGNTWEKKKSFWRVGGLNSIFFITSQVGFSMTEYFNSDCVFYKTTDAGETWVLKTFSLPFKDVFFIDRNMGFAIALWSFGHGWGGDIFFTNDGGITWNHNLNCGYVLSLVFVNDLTGYFINNLYQGRFDIQKTVDQGQNWNSVYKNNPDSTGYGFYGYALDFMDENVGWAVGRGEWSDSSGACILGTEDRGENWNLVWKYPNPEEQWHSLNSIHVINSTAWAVGDAGMMVKYSDEGKWQLQTSVTDLPLNKVFFSEENHGWIAGGYFDVGDMQSILLKTKDAGITWTEKKIVKYFINDIYFADSLHGWAVGNDTILSEIWPQTHGVILETRDGGNNWIVQVEGLSAPINAVHFRDGYGWAVGVNGLILRTEDGSTWIDEENRKVYHLKFKLQQNYPNPFNQTTVISYQLKVKSEVDLSIYNLLGQKVTTLVDKNQPAGKYKVEWDAGGFASGIYIYRFETNSGFIKSRKLVLLK
jgi:photosystem II stability/assembly factor-like uncharacterized protein